MISIGENVQDQIQNGRNINGAVKNNKNGLITFLQIMFLNYEFPNGANTKMLEANMKAFEQRGMFPIEKQYKFSRQNPPIINPDLDKLDHSLPPVRSNASPTQIQHNSRKYCIFLSWPLLPPLLSPLIPLSFVLG